MSDTQFSLSWEQHMQHINYGLNKYLKTGEFVDMTLAVDGYFVKVHQMILSLVSPYIKDIIKSLKCTHPVIFLNNVSYHTLCSILDYVYKGEVQVSKEHLEDLIQAGKQLQIKGLQEINHYTMSSNVRANENVPPNENVQQTLNKSPRIKKVKQDVLKENEQQVYVMDTETDYDTKYNKDYVLHVQDETHYTNTTEDEKITCISAQSLTKEEFDNGNKSISAQNSKGTATPYFTTSKMGSLQLVLDKYMYYLRYTSNSASRHSQWKCLNYSNTKCPAFVITRHDRVIQSVATHSHPTHELQIAKKIGSGELYSTMKGAEVHAQTKNARNLIQNKRKSSLHLLAT
ncbi:modifier of mdg4-like [Maniola jurtina]|uniref:modifier of mdg4-like n=1 Tax=Maniola jurtina TaxID=191418 RepID=UPI001E68F0A7|nr:modifier of mdg4-like [Maniola jurtina]